MPTRAFPLTFMQAFAGGTACLWLLLVVEGRFLVWAEALCALAIVSVVPLAWALTVADDVDDGPHRLRSIGCVLVPLGALCGGVSMVLAPGVVAGSLAAVWALATSTIALGGVARLLRRGIFPIEEFAIDLGHIYVVVGAVWLVANRLASPLMGFQEPVVLYTATHFHYAGLAAPVIAGLVGRELGLRRSPGASTPIAHPLLAWIARVSTTIVLGGIPLVAAGIIFSKSLEAPAAVLLSSAMLCLMGLLVVTGVARLRRRDLSGLLLVFAGLALTLSMSMAVLFAVTASMTIGAQEPLIPYPTMVALHGSANALGFACCALLGFAMRPPRRRHERLSGSWPTLFGAGFIGPDFFDRRGVVDDKRQAFGQVAALEQFAHARFRPELVHVDVRSFFERTIEWSLHPSPRWHLPFSIGARPFAWFARHLLGQLELPVSAETEAVSTRCFGVVDDGRSEVVGYVRAYGTGAAARANFVAAYATHTRAAPTKTQTWLSVALPLPFCAMVSVLRFDDGERPGSLSVCSAPVDGEGPSDEGVFIATRFGPLRLPINERIDVWVDDDGGVRALHVTHVLGLRCMTLSYALTRNL
ncbi:MAG: YndJ family protein [Deltaproteobacteria bacterium]|nr:YndJ family protein [Deltaproteobacteria bacterium]